jgi:hypothetical protein
MSDTSSVCACSKWEERFDSGDKSGHVVINIGLENHCIGAANVSDEATKGNCVETFGGVIKFRIVNTVDGSHKSVACDGVDDDVCVPRLVLGKVGSSSSFASRSGKGN